MTQTHGFSGSGCYNEYGDAADDRGRGGKCPDWILLGGRQTMGLVTM